jgi:hypothetical protein
MPKPLMQPLPLKLVDGTTAPVVSFEYGVLTKLR